VSRRAAAVAGLVAWLLLLLLAPEKSASGLAVWGAFAALAVTASIVVARLLSRALRRAVLKDPP
jgi:hypothetical protein